MTDATIEDYIRGWAGTYLSDEAKVDAVTDEALRCLSMDAGRPLTAPMKQALEDVLEGEKKTVEATVQHALGEVFEDRFAQIMAPACAPRVARRLPEGFGAEDEIPALFQGVARSVVYQGAGEGHFDHARELYEEGKLAERID